MEIYLNTRLYGKILTVKDTNVVLEEDVEERIYEKDENGKTDCTKPYRRDISTQYLDALSDTLSEMISYRTSAFDSSDLVTALFDKIPIEKRQETLNTLKNYYDETED